MDSNADKELMDALRGYAKTIYKIIEENQGTRQWALYFVYDSIGDLFPQDDEYVKRLFPLVAIPEAERYREAITKHPDIKNQISNSLGIGPIRSMVGKWTVLRDFVFELINRTDGVSFPDTAFGPQRAIVPFDDAVFDSLFIEMMDFFRSKTIPIRVIYPLEHFKLLGEPIELEDGWKIQNIPSEYRQDIISHMGRRSSSVPTRFGWISFALVKECEFERKIGIQDSYEEETKLLNRIEREKDRILSALRVLKTGGVIARANVFKSMKWHVGAPTFDDFSLKKSIPEGKRKEYELAKDDESHLNDIINSLKSVRRNPSFDTSLRRLNFASERLDEHRQDKILDFMIALESLLIGPTDRELQYRLSLRCAMLVGKSQDERTEILTDIGVAYQLRSWIVHGYAEKSIKSKLKDCGTSYELLTNRVSDLLRESMRCYLSEIRKGKGHQQIIQTLNSMILNDASLKSLDRLLNSGLSTDEIMKALEKLDGVPKRLLEYLRSEGILQKSDSE
jgi:hypothetical protein